MKNRILTINGFTCEIIGASDNCRVLINGASHPIFFMRYSSIKQAINHFKQWAKRK